MPLYICAVHEKSTVLKIEGFEGGSVPAAIAQAERLCGLWPQSTRFELWSDGVKLHSGLPGESTQPHPGTQN